LSYRNSHFLQDDCAVEFTGMSGKQYLCSECQYKLYILSLCESTWYKISSVQTSALSVSNNLTTVN